jgi:hypothetical protein
VYTALTQLWLGSGSPLKRSQPDADPNPNPSPRPKPDPTPNQALTLLEYLIRNGSERSVEDGRDHIYQIRTLCDFQFTEPGGVDQVRVRVGVGVTVSVSVRVRVSSTLSLTLALALALALTLARTLTPALTRTLAL